MPEPTTAEEWAADIFGLDVAHITEAPKHCGDGWDGACLKGDCEVLEAPEKLRAYARRVGEAVKTQVIAEAQERANHGSPDTAAAFGLFADVLRALPVETP